MQQTNQVLADFIKEHKDLLKAIKAYLEYKKTLNN